jgi:hypothetical protein
MVMELLAGRSPTNDARPVDRERSHAGDAGLAPDRRLPSSAKTRKRLKKTQHEPTIDPWNLR